MIRRTIPKLEFTGSIALPDMLWFALESKFFVGETLGEASFSSSSSSDAFRLFFLREALSTGPKKICVI